MNTNGNAQPLSPFLEALVEKGLAEVRLAAVANSLPTRELQEKAIDRYREESAALIKNIVSSMLNAASGSIIDGAVPPQPETAKNNDYQHNHLDPIGDWLWPIVMGDLENGIYWDVRYGISAIAPDEKPPIFAWHFNVDRSESEAPRVYLKRWFLRMAEAMGEPSLENLPEKEALVRLENRFVAANEADAAQRNRDVENARLPKDPREEEELYKEAAWSPEAGYAWIYGKDSFFARRVRGLRWKDLFASHYQVGIDRAVAELRRTAGRENGVH